MASGCAGTFRTSITPGGGYCNSKLPCLDRVLLLYCARFCTDDPFSSFSVIPPVRMRPRLLFPRIKSSRLGTNMKSFPILHGILKCLMVCKMVSELWFRWVLVLLCSPLTSPCACVLPSSFLPLSSLFHLLVSTCAGLHRLSHTSPDGWSLFVARGPEDG